MSLQDFNIVSWPPYIAECSSYKLLDQADRSVSSSSKTSASCDRSLNGDWYRFSDAAGKQMSQSCPPVRHCGTHATGWLNGTHPVIGDGVVTRQVCFHWKKGCCQWKRDIRVLNCGEFYVYQLQKPPVCNSRYCGGSIGKGTRRFLNSVALEGATRFLSMLVLR